MSHRLNSTLVLTPTDLERRQLLPQVKVFGEARIELCGFGVVGAAARTAYLLARNKPDHVILIGMAGTYDDALLAIGDAACFDEVTIDGIGAGCDEHRLSAQQIGFPHWPGGDGTDPTPIQDSLKLFRPQSTAPGGTLLTVCATSANQAEMQDRRQRFPQAVAEDMEGFAVALACRMAGVPLTIIRGISNRVGVRDIQTWRIDEPLGAAGGLLCEILGLPQTATQQ